MTKILSITFIVLFAFALSSSSKAQDSKPPGDYNSLSAALQNPSKVIELSLREQNIQAIPASIGELKNLKGMDLSHNPIQELPGTIGNLKNLEEIWLIGCSLQTLPPEIGNLKKLKQLFLQGNPLVDNPQERRALKKILPRTSIIFNDRDIKGELP